MKYTTYPIWEPTQKEIEEMYRALPQMEQDLFSIGFMSYSCSADVLELNIGDAKYYPHKIVYQRKEQKFFLTTRIKDFVTGYCPLYFKSTESIQKFIDTFNKK